MIVLEKKLVSTPDGEFWKDGYFLSIDQLKELVREFHSDFYNGFVSDDKVYIKEWMKKRESIDKK